MPNPRAQRPAAAIPYFESTTELKLGHRIVWYGDQWECSCGLTTAIDWHARFHNFQPKDQIPKRNPFLPKE